MFSNTLPWVPLRRAAALNLLAAATWLGMNPQRAASAKAGARARWRVAIFVGLILVVIAAVIVPKFILK